MKVNDSENKLAQIRWRCRRGMLELDVMLQNFFDQEYAKLSVEKQKLFEELLDEADQDLQRWLLGAQACDKPKFQDMLLIIRHLFKTVSLAE